MRIDPRPVVLVGFMATGKTTVGRLVAARLGRAFVDLDRVIEEGAGVTVAEIFKTAGEPGFRRLEAEALASALAMPDVVIATGGGAACRETNLVAMLARGQVVALSAPPDEALRRAGRSSGRPLLDSDRGDDDALAAARALLEQREPFYARAHHRVSTVGRTPGDVALQVVTALGGSAGTRSPTRSPKNKRGRDP